MGRANPQLLAFNGGEIGGQALARVDLEIYPQCGETVENCLVYTQGSIAKAPGTQFLRETPANGAATLRPFVFNESQTFVLEMSSGLLRFISGDGYVALEGGSATLGSWTDESGAAETGGGAPSDGGGSGEVGNPSGPGGGWGYSDTPFTFGVALP